MPEFQPNTLYYGDNLTVLRDFPPECVDLVYLDPPFNSNRSYNVLFKESRGTESEAQIQAFEDTWHWGKDGTTAAAYDEIASRGDEVGQMLKAFVDALGHNDVTAYLTMMAPRLVELRRVLKPTGSIYLHCDPTAGHYLKVLMDAVFGPINFVNEIVWKRTTTHSDAKRWSRVSDTLLYYGKTQDVVWNPQYLPHTEEYLADKYHYRDRDGRHFTLDNLTSPNPRPNLTYEWKGHPPPRMGWRYSRETMAKLDAEGRIWYPDSKSKRPRLKRFLDEMPGVVIGDVWTDISPVNSRARERLGYPTQKPEALLERIIAASSDPGDVVLDPFCGCGTAVVSAHRLERRWVGIDITWLAVALMRDRLLTRFPTDFPEGIPVDGEPADEAAALALADRDKYQFQFWAVAKLGGTARGGENRKGRDRGIDGVMAFPEYAPDTPAAQPPDYKQVVISVKGGATGPADVRDLVGTVERESAAIGVFVTARHPTPEMEREAASAGLYKSTWDGSTYPKIQILTAGDVVRGTRVNMPSQRGMPQYTPAPRARRGRQGRLQV